MEEEKKLREDELKELYDAIVKIDNVADCKDFLDDLLSKQELISLSGRVHCAKMFIEGKTYVEVNEATQVSSATLARVSKCVKYGKGYNKILGKPKK
ncbi:MAG: YerC/YecD family TrpR-related protein [Bacilli bacterium]|jgi:TrpR-related protein YerC/YecD